MNSVLHDEKTFYEVFLKDLNNCKNEVIIESPFITTERMNRFRSIFKKFLEKRVKIYVLTRDPREHKIPMSFQAEEEIQNFEKIGVQTLLCSGNHHRKLAMIDRKILWEGSLNILPQAHSREIMRIMENEELTMEMFNFLKLTKYIIK